MKLTGWLSVAALALILAGCEASAPTGHKGPLRPSSASAERTSLPLRPTSGTAADAGTVAGTFMRVGGPIGPGGMQPRAVPLMGTLTFAASHHRIIAVHVGNSGRFSVRLPAGEYLVVGRSPSIVEVLASGATVEDQCSPAISVTVVSGRTVQVSVVCPVP